MKLRLLHIVLCMACLVIVRSVLAQVNEAATLSKPCVVFSGAESRIIDRQYLRIKSQKDWIEVWTRHKGYQHMGAYDIYHDPAGLPLVDYDRFMVIAIFQGSSWNCSGIKAEFISETSNNIVFRFDNKSYQTTEEAEQVTPYGFFVLPASSKPVILEENIQTYIGGPPDWKERVRFPKM